MNELASLFVETAIHIDAMHMVVQGQQIDFDENSQNGPTATDRSGMNTKRGKQGRPTVVRFLRDKMNFAEKLKQLRVKNEYYQDQLAEQLHVSRQAISKWESGSGMPDIDNLRAIADVFDVTLDSLIRDEEDVESTDEGFSWKFAVAGSVVGFSIGFMLLDFIGTGIALSLLRRACQTPWAKCKRSITW